MIRTFTFGAIAFAATATLLLAQSALINVVTAI